MAAPLHLDVVHIGTDDEHAAYVRSHGGPDANLEAS